ncbi:MAG: intracellular septation protein [Candidatus Deianiraeaceae bacterium]|jgi:intracellular septation protein
MQQILSMIPIIIFFIAYKFGNLVVPSQQPIIIATFCLVVVSALSLLYHFVRKIKQDKMVLYSNIAIVILGGMTVIFHNPTFIKVKITLINAIFGAFMVYNCFKEVPPIQKFFHGKIIMENKSWRSFALRLAIMFFAIAIGNEFVYHYYTEATWVKYKVFYVPIFSFAYFMLQVKFLMKHSKKMVIK